MKQIALHPTIQGYRWSVLWPVVLATMALVLVSGVLASYAPTMVVVVLAVAGVMVLLTGPQRNIHLFLPFLAVVLVGYIVQGKSFAYLGLPPLYVGELALALGLATLAIGRIPVGLGRLEMVLLLFMTLGAIRTLPYFPQHGLMVLRDAAVWYYAAFAIIVSLLFNPQHWRSVLHWLQLLMMPIVVWYTVMPVLFQFLPAQIPPIPGSDVPILAVTKPGDRAVFLVLIFAFVITGLSSLVAGSQSRPRLFWLFWLAGAFMVAAWNRGGMLAILVGMLVLMLLMPSREWFKPITIGAIVLALFLTWNPTIDTGGYRSLSAQQLAVNFVSIFSDETEDLHAVQGTKDWRLSWWQDIYDDVVTGDDFWTGKGFGINLANEYGYQTDARDSLRSPHNIHMTILARMGVPGMALWLVLHLGFANAILRAFRSAQRQGARLWASTFALILPVWTAALINATFDVYLEGPQGAIPFWCLFGVGLGALRLQGESTADDLLTPSDMKGGPDAYPACP